MSEMRIAPARANFDAFHPVGKILFFDDALVRNWLGEIGSPGAAVKLIERAKERLAGDDIDINSGTLIVPIIVMKCRLRSVLPGNAILFFLKFGSQHGVARNWFQVIEGARLLFLLLLVAKEKDSGNHRGRAKQT